MFESFKKRKELKDKELKDKELKDRAYRRNKIQGDELFGKVYRDGVIKELSKKKPELLTNLNEKLSEEEVFYNKYKFYLEEDIPNTNWFLEIKENYNNKAYNFFIIYGNVLDQVIPKWSLEDYLKQKLIEELHIWNICTLDYVYLNNVSHYNNQCNANGDFENRLIKATKIIKEKDLTFKKALIIRYPEIVLSNVADTYAGDRTTKCVTLLKTLMNDIDFCESGNVVFIVVDNIPSLNSHLTQVGGNAMLIEVPYPNTEQRIEMINYLNKATNYMIDMEDETRTVANLTAGLNLNHIEKIWRNSIKNYEINYDKLSKYKKEMFRKVYEDKIDILEPSKQYSLDNYGGMDYIKDYLRKGVIRPILNGDKEMIPKGMLFMGSTGTGKSYLAKCIASESGINFVELSISKFISKWVGETELNLSKALMCVKSLAPCFLFIDEIEQIIKRGDDSSPVLTGNIFQMMMNFMGDPENRGKIIVIGATNYPNKLDEALKRAGRFDIKLVFTPPTNLEDTETILKMQLNKINYPIAIEYYSDKFKELVRSLKDYTQAELELVVVKALSLAKREYENCITIETLMKASSYIVRSNNDRLDEMIDLALEECNDLEFLSKELIERKNNNIKTIKWD